MRDIHIVRYFRNGLGHIESRGDHYLVSFYGRRVWQAEAVNMKDARRALGRLSRNER
jgi:hypothetical protein